jgi:hypothetical protein
MNENSTDVVQSSSDAIAQLKRIQIPALVVGIVGIVLWIAGFFAGGTKEQFFQSYLFAYLFWLGIPLGSFALLMLQYLANGMWGFAVRRLLEAAALTLPFLALLFVPIAVFGMQDLYPWSVPEVVAADHYIAHKTPYLNVPFFYLRFVIYFLFWIGWTLLLVKWSSDQDKQGGGDPASLNKFRNVSGPGIVLYFLTMTFAAFDWGMSVDPRFFSAIYGVIFIIGQGLSTFAFMILIIALLSKHQPFSGLLVTKHFHDLGNLLFAFTILWTYMSLSQFIIVWSGNLPDEIKWYIARQEGSWNVVAISVVLVQFVLPFFLLLNRFMKRRIQYLWKVAVVIFIMRFVDLFWLILPSFYESVLNVHWMTYLAPVGIGGVWVFIFIEVLKRRPLLPLGDPQSPALHAQEALSHG